VRLPRLRQSKEHRVTTSGLFVPPLWLAALCAPASPCDRPFRACEDPGSTDAEGTADVDEDLY
jgi:hypothetical protein